MELIQNINREQGRLLDSFFESFGIESPSRVKTMMVTIIFSMEIQFITIGDCSPSSRGNFLNAMGTPTPREQQ
jgi:hypothetical protein